MFKLKRWSFGGGGDERAWAETAMVRIKALIEGVSPAPYKA